MDDEVELEMVQFGMPIIPKPIFVFLDESGNFDFTLNGSIFFVLTSVRASPPFPWDLPFLELKYELLRSGRDEEFFHATEDMQVVRDRVFGVVHSNLGSMQIDSLIVEKRKTGPALRPLEVFYPRMMGYLLKYVLEPSTVKPNQEIVIVTDSIPIKKKREIVEKAIKQWLSEMMPAGLKYSLLHHESKSCLGLQVVDYCGWAVMKKWTRNDARSYDQIKPLHSEFDIFAGGTTFYY